MKLIIKKKNLYHKPKIFKKKLRINALFISWHTEEVNYLAGYYGTGDCEWSGATRCHWTE